MPKAIEKLHQLQASRKSYQRLRQKKQKPKIIQDKSEIETKLTIALTNHPPSSSKVTGKRIKLVHSWSLPLQLMHLQPDVRCSQQVPWRRGSAIGNWIQLDWSSTISSCHVSQAGCVLGPWIRKSAKRAKEKRVSGGFTFKINRTIKKKGKGGKRKLIKAA